MLFRSLIVIVPVGSIDSNPVIPPTSPIAFPADILPSIAIEGTAIILSIVSDFIPKKAVAVINKPDTKTNIPTLIPVTFDTGIANIATPTPNQPTCVADTKNDTRYEPFSPNEYLASKCVESPVSPA